MTLRDPRSVRTVAQRSSPARLGAREVRGRAHAGRGARSLEGEVTAQAIHPAALTGPEDRSIHPAQTWFLLPGDTSLPVDYTVRDVRDGGSFTTRSVDATQGDRVIFTMTASFQRPEAGLEHQVGEIGRAHV